MVKTLATALVAAAVGLSAIGLVLMARGLSDSEKPSDVSTDEASIDLSDAESILPLALSGSGPSAELTTVDMWPETIGAAAVAVDEHRELGFTALSNRLVVHDLSVASSPVFSGSSSETWSEANRAVYDDGYLYVVGAVDDDSANTDLLSGLWVFDTAEPSQPDLVADVAIDGGPFDLAINGDHAYITDGTSRLHVVDISQPDQAYVVGSVSAGYPRGVAVSGQYAYVVDAGHASSGYVGTPQPADARLIVFDITTPHSPVLAGSTSFAYLVDRLAVVEGFAYVAGTTGFYIFDVVDPQTPALIGELATWARPTGILRSGDHVYVTQTSGKYYDDSVMDILLADPSAPDDSEVQAVQSLRRGAYDLALLDDALFVAGGDGSYVLDTASALAVTAGPLRSWLNDLAVVGGDLVVAADEFQGLRVIDVSDPGGPLGIPLDTRDLISVTDDNNIGVDIVVDGENAFLRTIHNVIALELSDPREPEILGDLEYIADGGSYTLEMQQSGDHLFILPAGGRPVIVDVSTPSEIQHAAALPGHTHASDLAIAGNHAFLVTVKGLFTYDITDPVSPTLVSAHEMDCSPETIAVAGDLAYIPCDPPVGSVSANDMAVVDVSIKSQPVAVTSIALPHRVPNDIAVNGDWGFIASNHGGVAVLDLSTPGVPMVAGTITDISYAFGVLPVGNLLYVTTGAQLKVYDISSPGSPVLVGVLEGPG